jgi:hypothetical protein
METPKIKWAVGLSDGSNQYEGKGDYQFKEGTLSPYQRLLKHLEKEKLTITSLALYMDDGRRWNLPSEGNKPKFKIFQDIEKPVSYRFFRKAGMDIGANNKDVLNKENYAVIEANYKDKKLQVFVDEKYPHASWSLTQ